MLLLAFGIKAAVFPLSAWLPDTYPTAPAPVTAVFAGLLTKVGVYAIIRTQTLLFPGRRARRRPDVAALATMVVGILGAVAQADIKRILSFTLVSHIGYMVFGIALATTAGLAGAIYYVVHHITVQTTLFLVVGLVERQGGSTSLTGSAGWPRSAPLLAVLFFVPAMNLAGIPPLSGFLGKLGLLRGRRRGRQPAAAVGAGRRRRGDQPADARRRRPRLEPRVLAPAGAVAGRWTPPRPPRPTRARSGSPRRPPRIRRARHRAGTGAASRSWSGPPLRGAARGKAGGLAAAHRRRDRGLGRGAGGGRQRGRCRA